MTNHDKDDELPKVIDASDLGWRAGEWPGRFVYLGHVIYRVRPHYFNGEFVGYDYVCPQHNTTLHVVND